MAVRSPLTVALLAGWAALLVAVASCGAELRIAPDGDASSDRDAVVGEGGGSDGGPPDGGPVTCDASLASDPANCGACGHSCGTAACADSRCGVERLPVDASTFTFEPGARVAVRDDRGILTDGRPQGAAGGDPAFVLTFDPTSPTFQVASSFTFQNRPSLALVGASDSYWTDAADTRLRNASASAIRTGAGTLFALAASPLGSILAARVDVVAAFQTIEIYDPSLVVKKSITIQNVAADKGRGVAVPNEAEVLIAVGRGIDRCSVDTGACALASDSPGAAATFVAARAPAVVFTTVAGELREGSLTSTSSTVIASGLVAARAVALQPDSAYVLDDKGIHTTRYGGLLLLVKADPDAIIDFAVAPPWVYFITPKSFYRVRL